MWWWWTDMFNRTLETLSEWWFLNCSLCKKKKSNDSTLGPTSCRSQCYELLPVPPGEAVLTASLWTGCVHLMSESCLDITAKIRSHNCTVCTVAVQSIWSYCKKVIILYLCPSQVSCSIFLWVDLRLCSSVSPEPVCFHSRADTALSLLSELGTGSMSWWLFIMISLTLCGPRCGRLHCAECLKS